MIFKIKKEERLFALAACLVFVAFNGLLIYNKFDRFTLGEHVGFWSVFYNHLNMSGYDVFSCIAVSCLRIHFSTLRHPLYIALLLPIYWLNSWIMKMTGFNCAIFFIAAVNIFCATYSALFILRTLHELVGLTRRDACLLTAMLFSFAHVLIATMVPDHFCISLFLLTLTLYVTGRKMKEGRRMSPLLSGTLFFLTAGVTLTNGVKTCLSVLFANGRKAFAWRYMTALALSALLLGGIVVWQNEAIVEPQSRKIKKIENSLKKKDPNFGNKFKAHDEWVKKQNGKAMTEDVPLLKWSDMTTSRFQSLSSNLFGESIQLHRDHLLEDVQQTRPVFVDYRSPLNYLAEGAIIILFTIGICYGRRSRLMLMALSWFGFDLLIHIIFGFGINEVYIMTAHWAFVIPLAVAFTLRDATPRIAAATRIAALLLTLWLWIYNGVLIVNYLT